MRYILKYISRLWVLLLAGCLLLDGAAGAQSLDLYPVPYEMEGLDIGAGKPEISVNKSASLPDWASIEVQHRTRYETLDHSFRAGSVGGDQVISLRTLAQGEIRFNKNFMFKAELQDARAELVDKGTLLLTTIVNPADLLEANFQWNSENLFADGSKSVLRAGRITMDIGDRRLVARNRWRNTINAFTGLDGIWQSSSGNQVRAFYTLPVDRLPADHTGLSGNDGVMDRERLHRRFWGIFVSSPNMPWGNGEVYYFNLKEEDAPDFATQNRHYNMPGARIYRTKSKGAFDFELASTLMIGTSRASTAPSDSRDLDHLAYFHHEEIGYTFDASWSPRLLVEYNYASGDANSHDNKNGAYEILYGKAVTDHGPTSIYQAFTRSNVSVPGARAEIKPTHNLTAFISYQAYWLAEKTAAWAGSSGLMDASGSSGSFLGHQLFSQARWQALSNLQLEGGIAYRTDSGYQNTNPLSPREGNTTYTYVSTTLFF